MSGYFVHLRNTSPYSLARGMLRLKDLLQAAVRDSMPALALTDRDNFFGAMEFSQLALQEKIQPIIGCDVLLTYDKQNGAAHKNISGRVALLCQSEQGYQHLIAMMSDIYDRQTHETVLEFRLSDFVGKSGIIILTGGNEGALMPYIANGQESVAESFLDEMARVFPGRCYIELQRHQHQFSNDKIEAKAEPVLLQWASKKSLPLVATNDCHFLTRDLVFAQSVLMCIGAQKTINHDDYPKLTAEHYFKTQYEMQQLFYDIPEAIEQTEVIAKRCHFILEKRKPILPVYSKLEGRKPEVVLEDMALMGLKTRLAQIVTTHAVGANSVVQKDAFEHKKLEEQYRQRLLYELSVVKAAGLSGYFLIVADFINFAKQKGIPVGPGRGSAAGSLIAYVLGITKLDPIRYGLFFERFLNPGRVQMPDVDIDFCQDRRDEVLRYVQQEYGLDHVAQIITFGSLQARAAVRDVGRVLGHPYGQIDGIAKLIPTRLKVSEISNENPELGEEQNYQTNLRKSLDQSDDFRKIYETDEVAKTVVDLAEILEGLYRNASTHAAGVVMAGQPLKEIVPLYRDLKTDSSMPVTQFAMKSAELAGLIKFDFLGLKTLSIIDHCLKLVKKYQGKEVDLDTISLNDTKAFQLLSLGKTLGIFQFESEGITNLLINMQPDRLENLIAAVALYRPGPMENIPNYLDLRRGDKPIEYLHSSLSEALSETYGIPIYQEQVMEIARAFAGFDATKAETLRSAMGKKLKKEMAILKDAFITGAIQKWQGTANPVNEVLANNVYDLVFKFAGYGFNKSHAAAYGLVAYHTAYLKTYYPHEFFAAAMTYDRQDTDRLALYAQELKTIGIKLLPPDILTSEAYFTVEYDTKKNPVGIRYGLAAIKNVGIKAVEEILLGRQKLLSEKEPKDIWDFLEKINAETLNKRMLENLIAVGAFDKLETNRNELFSATPLIVKFLQQQSSERISSMVSLFAAHSELVKPQIEKLPNWDELQLAIAEKEALGFYLYHHPLKDVEELGARYQLHTCADLRNTKLVGELFVLAIVKEVKMRKTKTGKDFAIVHLSDMYGMAEVNLFDPPLNKLKSQLTLGDKIIAQVEVRLDKLDPKRIFRNIKNIFACQKVLSGKIKLPAELKKSANNVLGHREADLTVLENKRVNGTANDAANIYPFVNGTNKTISFKLMTKSEYRQLHVIWGGQDTSTILTAMQKILSQQKKGRGQIYMQISLPNYPKQKLQCQLGLALKITDDLANELQQLGLEVKLDDNLLQ